MESRRDSEKEVKHEKKEETIAIGMPMTFFGGAEAKINLSEKLVKACIDRHSDLALELLAQGADINYVSRKHTDRLGAQAIWSPHGSAYFATSPIISAVIHKLDRVVSALIDQGVDVNKTYSFNFGISSTAKQTLLHIAAGIPNNGKTIRALIAGGANLDAMAQYKNGSVCCVLPPVSKEHSAYLQKEIALSCFMGCLVFTMCCILARGNKVTMVPNVTPLQVATYLGYEENIEALKPPAPKRMAMQ